MKKNKGAILYDKNKSLILGGNMLLSKKPEMILPNYWPTYYKKAEETYVWDINNEKYLDVMCYVGQNTLGYNNESVNSKVLRAIKNGNMSSLNSYEEVLLTKKLLKIHKWAGMAKYARSGGEANVLAIRIARSVSKKENIAICGYHGWHDWYLSVNLKNKKNLNQHFLPGLKPDGVPKKLSGTVFPFNYGDLDKLKYLVKNKNLAAIKMEVARSKLPDIKFLKQVSNLAKKNNVLLIFDECTSGFRRNLGGLHLTTGVNPDLAMFGKALGNGYAITAVLGKKKVMQKASDSFISSTFWSERIGFVAALSTLNYMEKHQTWKKLIKHGKYLNAQWEKLSKKYKIPIEISGIESITQFSFKSKRNQEYKTLITQEMLKNKILATNLVFLNIFHTKKIIDKYIIELDKIFKIIKKIEDGEKIKKYLKSKVSHIHFQRLTN